MTQKQGLLNQLNGYLTGNDNVKKVMNSPCLDHNGKMLSYDGQKIFTPHNRGRSNRGRGGNNNRGDRQDRKRGSDSNQGSSGNGRGGKAKKPVSIEC